MRKTRTKRLLPPIAAMMIAVLSLTVFACGKKPTPPPVDPPKAPISVAATGSTTVLLGKTGSLVVADYITANGNPVTAESASEAIATAAIDSGVLKITPVAVGDTTVTMSCTGAGVTVTAAISVAVEEYSGDKYTVTVNGTSVGEFMPGDRYVFPEAIEPEDDDFEFDHWSITGSDEQYEPGDGITVDGNIAITAVNVRKAAELVEAEGTLELRLGRNGTIDVADYITTHGNTVTAESTEPSIATTAVSGETVAVHALAEGETDIVIECGDVSATVTLTVLPRPLDEPSFDDETLDIDLYDDATVTLDIAPSFVPAGKTFTYAYSVASGVPAAFAGDVLTYTPSGEKTRDTFTVTVTATPDAGDAKTVEFTVTVNIANTSPAVKQATVTRAQVADMYMCADKLDLSDNISNAGKVTGYTVAVNGGTATASGAEYSLSALEVDTNGLTPTEVTLTVRALYKGDRHVEYTYKLSVIDSAAYRVKNGGFESGDLTHWTPSWETDKPIGNVTNADRYFANVEYGKDGEWLFSGACDLDANNGREDNVGTLASDPFTLRPNALVTFKLGGAINIGTGIKFVKADGTVLAQFYNTDHDAAEGKLVQYKYTFDNQAAIENVRVVIFDLATTGNWRLVTVDSIETYVTTEPADAIAAQNVYADKSALRDAAVSAPTERGDYTDATYNALAAKLAEANKAIADDYISAADVALLAESLTAAKQALELRAPVEIAGKVKSFRLMPTNTKEIVISEYVDTLELSSMTYSVASDDTNKLAVSEISGGKFTATAVADGDATVTLKALYKGIEKLSVEFAFTVTSVADPTLKEESVMPRSRSVDLYDATNKTDVELDFGAFVDNPASVALTIAATEKIGSGTAQSITLDAGKYTFTYDSYTDEYTAIVFDVTVGYGASEPLSFTYTLNVRNTTAYRIKNGGFETGNLTDWTMTGNIGEVSSATGYWGTAVGSEILFQKEGTYFFHGRENKNDDIGTLSSSTFTVGGSGYITFLLGAGGHWESQYIEIVDADSNTVLEKYSNHRFVDAGGYEGDEYKISGETLIKYKADLSAHRGKNVFIRVVDNHRDGGIGMMMVDNFVTYYESVDDIDGAFVAAEYKAPNA